MDSYFECSILHEYDMLDGSRAPELHEVWEAGHWVLEVEVEAEDCELSNNISASLVYAQVDVRLVIESKEEVSNSEENHTTSSAMFFFFLLFITCSFWKEMRQHYYNDLSHWNCLRVQNTFTSLGTSRLCVRPTLIRII